MLNLEESEVVALIGRLTKKREGGVVNQEDSGETEDGMDLVAL